MSRADAGPRGTVRHGAATDPGRLRTGNEDALLVDAALGLFAVADGLGGHRAGEVASRLALERIHACVRDGAAARQAHGAVLVRALVEGHEAVRDAALDRPETAGMGTTAVVAWVPDGRRLSLAHVGDSRAYLLRGGRLERLTDDDTLLEELRRAGALDRDPAAWPPRQQLTQALGPAPAVVPHVAERALAPGDRLLLCSDGLTDMLSDGQIRYIAGSTADPQAACDLLVDTANELGGVDNITVVVVEIVLEDDRTGP